MPNIPFLTSVDIRGNLTIGTLRGTENEAYAANLLDSNSVIAFGDNSLPTQNVMVGEYGTTDTDQLWLHGKNGTFFSHDGDLNEAISIAMVIADDGKIGMGTQTLGTNKLSVVGNTNLSSGLLFTNESLTRVGIGTLFPDELLHVDGPCKIRGLLKLDQNNQSTFAGVNAGNLTNIIGSKNTAFGRDSLSVATSNSNNVAVGFEALKSSNTGNNNVAIGAESMSATTDSNGNNVAIGYQAAKSTNGARNVAIGAAALLANVNGIQNTAIGDNALSSLTANGNTALGYQAGSNLTNAQNNVIIGYQAQAGAATAQNQIVIGQNAVGDTTNNSVVIGNNLVVKTILKGFVVITDRLVLSDPSNNSFIGEDTGVSNTTGDSNVGLGYNSLVSNTTGAHNNAIGAGSLYSNISGGYNIAIGEESLYSSTAGNNNIGIGFKSLYTNLSGFSNIGLGQRSLEKNTTGTSNIAVGTQALWNNTTGLSNTALGSSSLLANTTGSANVAFGVQSLVSNTTGAYNVGMGYQAGKFAADGTTANATGSRSIFIGESSKANADGETNQIVIGDTAIGNGSNTVTLGNDSIVKTILKGSVGVGIDDPQSALQVNGGIQLAADSDAPSALKVGTFRYRTSGNNSYVDMCMQTAATTYAWVNIVQNNW